MTDSMDITAAWLQEQFGDLADIRPLSQGGQKQVFSAVHQQDGEVVLKLMHPAQDIERTMRELVAVAEVDSARVPKILESGTVASPVGECFWFREQRVPGEMLRAVVARGALQVEELLRLGLHVLESLVASERVAIVHRDVKPENIIRDPDGQFWLIDFGLARHLGLESLTATALAFGHVTWGYAPPEQCRNLKREIDSRADLFALGVTLYECATGANPFRVGASNALEVLQRVEVMPLPRLSLDFPAAELFADLVQTLVQKRRDHRPRTVQEAYEWMRQVCDENDA